MVYLYNANNGPVPYKCPGSECILHNNNPGYYLVFYSSCFSKCRHGVSVAPGSTFVTWFLENYFLILFTKMCVHIHTTGLQTSQDARFYASSARFEPFSNEGKTLVVQFTVKHEQKIDCGGGYVKVFPADQDQTDMHGDSQYYIMFGKWISTLTAEMISYTAVNLDVANVYH